MLRISLLLSTLILLCLKIKIILTGKWNCRNSNNLVDFLTERSIKNYQDWKLPMSLFRRRSFWIGIVETLSNFPIGGWRRLPPEQRV
jgi:hypothetical protein